MVCVPANLPALVCGKRGTQCRPATAIRLVALSTALASNPWLENAPGQPDSLQECGATIAAGAEGGSLKHAALAMLAVCLVALSGGHARADYTVVEVNFILADKDGDLLLSKTEYLLVPLDAFPSSIRTAITRSMRTSLAILPRTPSSAMAIPTKAGTFRWRRSFQRSSRTSKQPTPIRMAR